MLITYFEKKWDENSGDENAGDKSSWEQKKTWDESFRTKIPGDEMSCNLLL